MINVQRQANISLTFFFLAAALGVFLRFLYIFDIAVTYRYIVHAHSHIALLGWVYVGITTILYKLFLSELGLDKRYRIIFYSTQVTLIGMLFSFPFQGYAVFSILFSTLFLFVSYWFTWFFITNVPKKFKENGSYRCIKVALFYMVLSSIGPWALGVLMNTLGTTSIWYRIAIYFYLHFQYNGWMILALFGLLFFVIETKGIKLSSKGFNRFFIIFNLGIILSFFLSVLWAKPSVFYYLLGGLGGFLQGVALAIFVRILFVSRNAIAKIFSPFQKKLIVTVGILITMKFLLQVLSCLPYFANLAATIIEFTIGYLHWAFLGVISIALFLFFEYYKLIKISKTGYYSYFLGFLLTEGLIFYKGIVNWLGFTLIEEYFEVLLVASFSITIGIGYMLLYNMRHFKEIRMLKE